MLSWMLLFCLTTTANAQYWTLTVSLNNARDQHTATLLPNGNVLAAGGAENTGAIHNVELYNAPTGVWNVTGSLTYDRCLHTATLLPNGNVLVAAGGGGGNFENSAELYNASTGVWTVTGFLTYGRDAHTATLIPNGNVLIVAGCNGGNICDSYLNAAELYNATTGVWTVTGNLTYARYLHTATQLPNGSVLVAAGYNDPNSLNSAEVYNTATGVWTATGSLNTGRYWHTATLLLNGNVLVAGGCNDPNCFNPLISAELYNATTGVWTVTGNLTYARADHTATILPNGNVLVVGGTYSVINDGSVYLNTAELYNASAGVWTVTGSLTYGRAAHTATLLPNGNVLVAGGYNNGAFLNSAEVYIGPNITATATPTPTTLTSTPTPLPTTTSTPTPTSIATSTITSTSMPTRTSTPTPTSTPIPTFSTTPAPNSSPTMPTPTTPASITSPVPTTYAPTSSTTPTTNPTAPTPTSSSTSSTDATPTPSAVVASSSNAGAIAGGIIGGLVGLALLVLLLWLLRSRYWNKEEIKEKESKSLDNSGYSQPMLVMSDVKSEPAVSFVSVDPRTQSSDDILIPFTSLKLGAVLGQGNFGQVSQATYRGGPAAVKKLKGVDKQQIMEEAKMMKSVPNHSNVLQYFGVSEHEGEIMMVTELCDKGNLAQYLRNSNNKLTLIQCRQLCGQIASGMWHISTNGIVHRDLRSENILIRMRGMDLELKVADFGLARSLQSRDNTRDNIRDSAYYRMAEAKEIPIAWTPPEVLTDQLKYVAESDVWSFGVLMWEIYSQGARPFDDLDIQVVITVIRSRNRSTPLLARPDKCPDDIFAIMNSCWGFNPQDRPTFEQLFHQLS